MDFLRRKKLVLSLIMEDDIHNDFPLITTDRKARITQIFYKEMFGNMIKILLQ